MNHRKTQTLLLLAILLRGVSAFATNYYINNSTGSDSNSGTSSGSPWATFNNVNSHTFSAGDTINLACGCIWNQEMDLAGTGTSTNWITVTSYGSGNRPAIIRDGLTQGAAAAATERCIVPTNPDYWSFNNLEVGYAGAGIIVEFTTISHNGLSFNNIYAHDCAGIAKGSGTGSFEYLDHSAGITINGHPSLTASQYAISGISFSNIQGTHNGDTVHVGIYANITDGSDGHTIAQNITCNNLYFNGDNADRVADDATDGFALEYCENVTIMDSILNDECGVSSPTGTAATYCGVVQNLHLINCIIENTPNTGSPDMTGWDNEGFLNNINFEGDYFTGNAGAGIEFLAIHSGAQDSNNSVLSSLFVNNGNANGAGALDVVGNDVVQTGAANNNLYWEPHGFESSNGGSWSGFTFSNNLAAVRQTDTYNAGAGFGSAQGGSQWSYQILNGSSWSNMTTYNAATPAFWSSWGANSNADLIWPQALLPDSSNSWIARAWTAPSAGQVSIRGWAALAPGQPGGSGDLISITKNGTTIFGTSSTVVSNTTGFATNVDVAVNTGDIIRFQVTDNGAGNNTGDLLSWAPNIEYTSGGGGGGGTIYKIINRNSGLAVDVKGQGTTDGSTVQQYAYNGGANQQWTVTSLGNGYYKIIGVQSGLALDVVGGGTANGTGIDINAYTGASNQQWSLTPTSGGYYRLTPANATGSCLDVQHSSLSNGAPLEIYTYGGGNSQQWALQAP